MYNKSFISISLFIWRSVNKNYRLFELMIINYYTYKNCEFTCIKCKWSGKGSETKVGEVYEGVFEIDCPVCHEPVDSISHPHIYEILEYDEDENEKDKCREILDNWVDRAIKEIQQKNKISDSKSKTIIFSKSGEIDPEIVKQAVYSQINFVLPKDIWDEINTAFGECWNNEIGIRGWVHENQIENYIDEHLRKKKILFEYAKIETITKIIHNHLENISAYLDE